MDTGLKLGLTRLAKGEMYRIVDGCGKVVAAFHGRVWITQHADPRDIVLEGGATFTFDRHGLAMVQALTDSSILVFAPEPNAQAEAGSAGRHDSADDRGFDRMTAAELHHEARRQRSAAIGEALLGLLAVPRWLRARLGAAG